MLFELPSDYYSDNNTNSVTCTPACTGNGTKILRFTNLVAVNNNITLIINNIKNPPVSGYPAYYYYFYTSANVLIDNTSYFITPI